MKELSGDEVLSLPVRLHGIELGRPVDVLLDRDGLRVVGLDVLCGDEVHRFLPLPTAAIGDDALDDPLAARAARGGRARASTVHARSRSARCAASQ